MWVVTYSGDRLYGIFESEEKGIAFFNSDPDTESFRYNNFEYLGYPFGEYYFLPYKKKGGIF